MTVGLSAAQQRLERTDWSEMARLLVPDDKIDFKLLEWLFMARPPPLKQTVGTPPAQICECLIQKIYCLASPFQSWGLIIDDWAFLSLNHSKEVYSPKEKK